jgi:LAO/AO transport system kinase
LEKNSKKSALHEKDGIPQPESISKTALDKVVRSRKIQPSSEELVKGILCGDISALSRAITLVESTNPEHLAKANEIITACLPYANQSLRMGITGVPGVGKSTFIEAFGKHLTSLGKKVAVLAVDPSSSISHGSILGDKTRMEELVKDQNAYKPEKLLFFVKRPVLTQSLLKLLELVKVKLRFTAWLISFCC